MAIEDHNKTGVTTTKKVIFAILGIVAIAGIVGVASSANNIAEIESDPVAQIEQKEQPKTQEAQPKTQEVAKQKISQYSADRCQSTIEYLDGSFGFHTGWNNYILDEQDADNPDQKRIDSLTRKKDATWYKIEKTYDELVMHGCLDPKDNKYINK